MLHSQEDLAILYPKNTPKTGMSNITKIQIWELQIRKILKREAALAKICGITVDMIWGQCSNIMSEKVE